MKRTAYRFLSVLALVACAGLGLQFAAWAQSNAAEAKEVDAEAEEVLRGMAEYYRGLDSVSVKGVMEMHRSFEGQDMDLASEYDFAVERPNRFAMVPLTEGADQGGTVVSDGDEVYMYAPQLAKYTLGDSPETMDELMEDDLVAMLSNGLGQLVGAVMASDPYEALMEEFAGAEYVDREVVDDTAYHRIRLMDAQMPADVWIAAGDEPTLDRVRPDLSAAIEQAGASGQDVEMEMTIRFTDWEADADLADDRFAFDPPEDAEEVDTFFEEQAGQGGEHPILGKEAPNFTLSDLSGDERELASHEGEEIVILDFWATWCGPCVEAMPIITEVADEYEDQGVVLYGVNLQETPDQIEGFLEEHDLDVDVLLDRDGAVATAYGAQSIPQTVIIDKDGNVQAVHVGLLPDLKERLTSELDTLLEGEELVD